MFGDPKYHQRFFSKLRKDGDCLVWTAAKNRDGYGRFQYEGRLEGAHRISFFFKYGYCPPLLRHTCDNPACCRPKHLVEGTQQQNIDDKVERGRQHKGEQIHFAKLTEDDVREILRLCRTRMSYPEIAAHYGVDPQTISSIKAGRIWKHLARPRAYKKPYKCEVIQIGERHFTIAEIAAEAGVASVTIRARLERGLTGKNLLAGKHCAVRRPYGTGGRS